MTTPDYVHNHFAAHPLEGDNLVRPTIVCADGTRLSVQASEGHYCCPKTNDAERYSTVEVLSPMPLGKGFVRGDKTGDDHYLYPFVLVSRVNNVIHRHGGVEE